MQDHLNLWVADRKVPDKAKILVLSLSGEIDKDSGKRWKAIKGIIGRLSRRGFVTTHVPVNLRQKFLGDIAVLSMDALDTSAVMGNLSKVEGATVKTVQHDDIFFSEFPSIFMGAWQDWFREVMRGAGFLHQHKIGNTETMTVRPLQLELIHHFIISSNLSMPDVKAIAQEYYHLTFLEWVTFYQKSKFALPQRITQKTGEFLSAQVSVPKEVVVL